MIKLKNKQQLELMKEAGRITGEVLYAAGERIREGITTKELDEFIREFIERHGARPTFLGYGGFPGSACISVNEQVIHGIPSDKVILKDGDIVKIDVGAEYKGFTGDSACTFPVGNVSREAKKLIEVTRESFYRGIANAVPGKRVGDIGYGIESYVEENGFSVVRAYVGHGVGHDLHEDPEIPNYGVPGRGVRLCQGMTIAVEPMVNIGGHQVKVLDDKWTVVTADGSLSAHYEHSVAITDDGPLLLTKVC
ncbi:MAG: type I methionyl aminopeptidase [Clostridia bacterium]|nr:type I methionyl aminopeptidase [Clostridia bacterium]